MYWESQEKAQSHTHFSVLLFSVFRRLKSAVDQILQVPSAEAVASRLKGRGKLRIQSCTTHTHTHYSRNEALLPNLLSLIPNSGKLSREKTFANFADLCLLVKVSLRMWRCGVPWCSKSKQSAKSSLRENRLFNQFV